MVLDQLFNCVAPLVFSDPSIEDPFGGTCFRVNFHGRIYVVTARHCITHAKIDVARTRLECATPERTYLPLKAWHLSDTNSEDIECGDVAVFEVDLERMTSEEIVRVPTLDIERRPPPPRLERGWRLLVEGFPTDLVKMDDQRTWTCGSVKLEARYEGPDRPGMSKLSFLDRSAGYGISGSPVFAFEQIDRQTVRSGFAGMMIARKIFIDAPVIIECLQRANNFAFDESARTNLA